MVFIVVDGEIELTRNRNFGSKLMDPTKEDRIKASAKLSKEMLKNSLGASSIKDSSLKDVDKTVNYVSCWHTDGTVNV